MPKAKVSAREGSEIPGFVRELGGFERMLHVNHNNGSFILSNALFIVSKELITKDLLYKALVRLSNKVTNLRLCIKDEKDYDSLKSPSWVENKQVKIDLEEVDTEDWREIISQEWEKKFDCKNGPMWRVKFLPNVQLKKCDEVFQHECIVILSWPHTLLDGMSCQRVFGYFLDCLEDVHNNVTQMSTPLPLLPSVEAYLGIRNGTMDRIFGRIFMSILFYPRLRNWLLSMDGNISFLETYMSLVKMPIDSDPMVEKVGRLVPIEFTKDETLAIIRSCKARNLTVHPALHTASFLAFVKLLPDTKKDITIHSYCPIDLRRRCEEMKQSQDDLLGNYIYVPEIKQSIKSSQEVTSEKFWALCHDCSTQIRESIKKQNYLNDLKMMQMLLPVVEDGSIKMGDFKGRYNRFIAFYTTNMGRCDYLSRSDDRNFKLVGRHGGEGEQESGPIIANDINTFNDQLNWSVNYATHIIAEEKIMDYCRWVKEILNKFCGETKL